MKTSFIAQPDQQLGSMLTDLLATDPPPVEVCFVSAFVSLQTLHRIKSQVRRLKRLGCSVRFVLGIDLEGTSAEALAELLSWKVEVHVVKHRTPRHVFHPKLYWFKWKASARVLLGSSNLTDGGLFTNYEGMSDTLYRFPADLQQFAKAAKELERFLRPSGPTAYQLSKALLSELIAARAVPSEAEARRTRGQQHRAPSAGAGAIFGAERIPVPPALPKPALETLAKGGVSPGKGADSAGAAARASGESVLGPLGLGVEDPSAFFMTLPKLQGSSIPGEARIPLVGIRLAPDFWGWPDEYTKDVKHSPSGESIYWNWRPIWKTWSADAPENAVIQEVRMYLYENSMDFRFYARFLIDAGADAGDLVQIVRTPNHEAAYECILAKKGTAEYRAWVKACTLTVPNSDRRFGYA